MEMNIFLPQSAQAQIELEDIADVKRQIITPALSTPIIGIVQDGLLGSYNLTNPTMRLNWDDAMDIVCYTNLEDLNIKKNREYTGAELFSMIIPAGINLKNAGLEVVDGIIKSGQVTKAHIGAKKANSLIHLIWDQYGAEETKNFLDNIQRLVNNFNLLNGFTVGIGDIDVPLKLEEDLHKLYEKKMLEVDYQITEIENIPDLMDSDTFELSIFSDLNAIRSDVSKMIMENLKDDNHFKIMKNSGSKGDEVNMGQMACCLGQQAVEGKRIQKKVNSRSIAYFHQNDDSAKARGFIENSFLRGTTPTEFMFHNMSSREGLIDTAIKSVTGDTPIVILQGGVCKYVTIGEWIDKQLAARPEEVEHYKERDMELLKLKSFVYIPTTDQDGNVSWGEIKAITRHDPGKELYQIKTLGGRSVIVTESKSLLIWDGGKFERKSTPDVVIGDHVPVTMNLATPPNIMGYINLTKYFPTDFVEDVSETKKAPGWWQTSNGTKHLLTRVIKRSRVDNVRDSTNRGLPEQFPLNKENGQFIGLFLAEGDADVKTGSVRISNNDPVIKQFVKNWFDKYSIKHQESTKLNHTGVRGFSTLLARFITMLVGHGAKHKYVPNEAFNAPEEFIIGLVDGYISGDGTVTKSSVDVGSASCRLITGIQVLLNRLGIFGKRSVRQLKKNNVGTENIAPSNVLTIAGQWARLFANKITLLERNKDQKLRAFRNPNVHPNFPVHNDVVLDEIVAINKIDVKLYPKVYDLTIPSTLNFGLANGLHVVDTAESGYIQRKLVKSMEDAMIKYDLTVRSANNTIIQFIYGDSGVDATKQYEHKLGLLKMGNQEIRDKYTFSDAELKNISGFTSKQNDDYYHNLLYLRDQMRRVKTKVSLNYIVMDNTFILPMNLSRIVNNIKNTKLPGEVLTPLYVIQRLDDILEYKNTTITCLSKEEIANKNSLKHQDEMLAKTLFQFALHDFLAPKVAIVNMQLNKAQFDKICDEIVGSFNKSIIEAGTIVGTIAAQSIGEPVTQMSACYATQIRITGEMSYTGPIGKFIDDLLKKKKSSVKKSGKSYILDLGKDDDYKIIGVSGTEKTSWQKILQVTKHPANGGLVKVTTNSGKITTATLSHSFLKRTTNSITTTKGSDLKVGDRIPVARYIPIVENPIKDMQIGELQMKLDKQFGWICGAYLADGRIEGNTISISKILQEFEDNIRKFASPLKADVTIITGMGSFYEGGKMYPRKTIRFNNKDIAHFLKTNFGNGSYVKAVPAFVYEANKEFISGLIGGYFDGDGNVNMEKQMIRSGSRSEKLIDDMIVLLAYCGIFSSKLKEKSVRIPGKIAHVVSVQKKYASKFKEQIGFQVKEKSQELDEIIKYNNRADKHTDQDTIDQIPELGNTIATIGSLLKLPGQSRLYKRWRKKKAVGRRTVEKYITLFKEENKKQKDVVVRGNITTLIKELEQAVNADVVWDKIVKLEYLKDPKEYVYDFTVPGNDSFMVDCGILVHNTLNTFHHCIL